MFSCIDKDYMCLEFFFFVSKMSFRFHSSCGLQMLKSECCFLTVGQAGERRVWLSKLFVVTVFLTGDLLKVSMWEKLLFLCISLLQHSTLLKIRMIYFKDTNKSSNEIDKDTNCIGGWWWSLLVRAWAVTRPLAMPRMSCTFGLLCNCLDYAFLLIFSFT